MNAQKRNHTRYAAQFTGCEGRPGKLAVHLSVLAFLWWSEQAPAMSPGDRDAGTGE